MAESNRRGGESNQAGTIRPSVNPLESWSALLNVINKPNTPLQMSAENGVRFVFDVATGQEVFVIPDPNTGMFNSNKLYYNENEILSTLSILSESQTRNLEKALKLKPTGVRANEALIQRYMGEVRKASVNNVSDAISYTSGTINTLTNKPVGVVEQAKLSATAGDISGGGARRSRTISVTQFSEGDARAILENFYADTLGRRPDSAEVKKFQKAINAQAKKQPSVSTTTYGADGTSTTMSGGAGYSRADAEIAARSMAESDPEASSFLASTRYLDAFMNAIGSQA